MRQTPVIHFLVLFVVAVTFVGLAVGKGCGEALQPPTGEFHEPVDISPGDKCSYIFNSTKAEPVYFTIQSADMDLTDNLTFYNGSTGEAVVTWFSGYTDTKSSRIMVYVLAANTTVVFQRSNMTDAKKSNFSVTYSNECKITLDSTSSINNIMAPEYVATPGQLKCSITYDNKAAPEFKTAVSFPDVNITKGNLVLTLDSGDPVEYADNTFNIPDDFAINSVKMDLTLATTAVSKWSTSFESVSSKCSGRVVVNSSLVVPVPADANGDYLNNLKCRWLIYNNRNYKYQIKYIYLGLADQGDTAAVYDGDSKFSAPLGLFSTLGQVDVEKAPSGMMITSGPATTVTFNSDESQVAWGVFLFLEATKFSGRYTEPQLVSVSDTGSEFTNSSDVYLIFDTESLDSKVLLRLVNMTLLPGSAVICYDGPSNQDPVVTNLTTNDVFYEIASSGSQMLCMLDTFLKNKSIGQITLNYAHFQGYMFSNSMDMSGAFRLDHDMLKTSQSNLTWLIHATDPAGGVIRLWTSEAVPLPTCTLKISQGLSSDAVTLATSTSETPTLFPVIYIYSEGARITYECMDFNKALSSSTDSNMILFQAYYSNIPRPETTLKEKFGELFTPLYPDAYPLNSVSKWSVTIPPQKFIHVYFEKVEFVLNGSASIVWKDGNKTFSNTSTTETFAGVELPPDVIKPTGDMELTVTASQLPADSGWVLGHFGGYYEIIDCGGVLNNSGDSVMTPGYPAAPNMTTTCVWMIQLPKQKSTNIVSYTVTMKGVNKNTSSEISIMDGNTWFNSSAIELPYEEGESSSKLSRYDNLLIKYKYMKPEGTNKTGHPFAFQIKYSAHECKMLCDNGVCKHDDWVCNGIDDCGDNSDEKDCFSAQKKRFGAVIALAIILAIAVGVILALVVPKIYRRIRYRNYTQFSDSPSSVST